VRLDDQALRLGTPADTVQLHALAAGQVGQVRVERGPPEIESRLGPHGERLVAGLPQAGPASRVGLEVVQADERGALAVGQAADLGQQRRDLLAGAEQEAAVERDRDLAA
jgi:hypothetical protein